MIMGKFEILNWWMSGSILPYMFEFIFIYYLYIRLCEIYSGAAFLKNFSLINKGLLKVILAAIIVELATQTSGFNTITGLNPKISLLVGYDLTQVASVSSNITMFITGIEFILGLTLVQSIREDN